MNRCGAAPLSPRVWARGNDLGSSMGADLRVRRERGIASRSRPCRGRSTSTRRATKEQDGQQQDWPARPKDGMRIATTIWRPTASTTVTAGISLVWAGRGAGAPSA